MLSNQKTTFLITATTPEDDYRMEFTIPSVLSRTDWEEIARMLKQICVILSKLPVDPSVVLGEYTPIESVTVDKDNNTETFYNQN